jgi:hypothetical protein
VQTTAPSCGAREAGESKDEIKCRHYIQRFLLFQLLTFRSTTNFFEKSKFLIQQDLRLHFVPSSAKQLKKQSHAEKPDSEQHSGREKPVPEQQTQWNEALLEEQPAWNSPDPVYQATPAPFDNFTNHHYVEVRTVQESKAIMMFIKKLKDLHESRGVKNEYKPLF